MKPRQKCEPGRRSTTRRTTSSGTGREWCPSPSMRMRQYPIAGCPPESRLHPIYVFIAAGRSPTGTRDSGGSRAGGIGGIADAFAEQRAVVHFDPEPFHDAVQADESAQEEDAMAG